MPLMSIKRGTYRTAVTTNDDPTTFPLVQSENLIYEGAFDVYDAVAATAYGGFALAVNPATNTLFISGHATSHPKSAVESTIPTLLNPDTLSGGDDNARFANLNQSTLVQTITSTASAFTNGSYRIEGLLVYDNKLVIAGANPYESTGSVPTGTDALTHLVRSSLTLSSGSVTTAKYEGAASGDYKQRRFYSGYMCHIPTEWQALLGGPCITGYVSQSIASVASNGPSAMVFDPDDIDSTNETIIGTPLVAYVMGQDLDGGNPDYTVPDNPFFNTAWPQWNWRSTVAGCCIPPGTRTLLFIGTSGHGNLVYGKGVADRSLHTDPVPEAPGQIYAYDPANDSNGEHAYPYRFQMWAYDLNDLLQVKAGTLLPHEVQPYDWWTFELPGEGNFTYDWDTDTPNPDPNPDNHNLTGMTYDIATNRVYLSVGHPFKNNYLTIHGLTINNAVTP